MLISTVKRGCGQCCEWTRTIMSKRAWKYIHRPNFFKRRTCIFTNVQRWSKPSGDKCRYAKGSGAKCRKWASWTQSGLLRNEYNRHRWGWWRLYRRNPSKNRCRSITPQHLQVHQWSWYQPRVKHSSLAQPVRTRNQKAEVCNFNLKEWEDKSHHILTFSAAVQDTKHRVCSSCEVVQSFDKCIMYADGSLAGVRFRMSYLREARGVVCRGACRLYAAICKNALRVRHEYA
jgi:hypothetical protein